MYDVSFASVLRQRRDLPIFESNSAYYSAVLGYSFAILDDGPCQIAIINVTDFTNFFTCVGLSTYKEPHLPLQEVPDPQVFLDEYA